jgi:hypothetical protein
LSKQEQITVGHRLYAAKEQGQPPAKVPYIRLSGLWLAKQGFKVGAIIEVESRKGEVVLRSATHHRLDER